MSKKNGITAVGYARRSSDLQDRSIPDQKAYVERWARDNGYRIIRWYVDDAISGTSTRGRDDFARLIREAENGRDFDTVLCYDISRFSRGGTNETGYYLHRLHLAGVDAVFCAEGIPEGDEGELIQGVKSWQARQFSVKLSRDCIRGTISHIMQKHCAPGGMAPFGYDKQHCTASGQVLRTFRWLPDGRKQEFGPDGRLVRVLDAGEAVKKAKSDLVRYVPSAPERVATVRRIFDECLQGYGYHAIASRLNKDGVPSMNGGHWTANQAGHVLRQPAYRGAVAWNRRTVGTINGVAGDGTLRPKRGYLDKFNSKEDWFVVEDAHEPLVSKEVFEKVQKILDGRRTVGGLGKKEGLAPLAGLIVCTRCQYKFFRMYVWATSGSVRKKYHYYMDGGYHRGGKTVCGRTIIPAAPLDRFVLHKVRDIVLGNHKNLAKAVDAFVRTALAQRDSGKADTGATEKELENLNRRIKTMVAMLADADLGDLDELKTTLTEMKRRRDALRAKMEEPKPQQALPYKEADLRAWARDRFQQIENACREGASPDLVRQVLTAYVSRIDIDPDKKRGTLYLNDAYACLEQECVNRVAHGDCMGTPKEPHRKTIRHYDDPTHAHYLTFSCLRKQPFLSGRQTPGWLVESIQATRKSCPFDLWAWVFMPEHVHLLIWPHENTRIQDILKGIKEQVSHAALKWVSKNQPDFLVRMRHEQRKGRWIHRFWQRGPGYDRNVWSPQEIREKIGYIHANPVRRGLVERPGDWPWSSYKAWEEGIDEPLKIDFESVPPLR